jgi:hypothetical protein
MAGRWPDPKAREFLNEGPSTYYRSRVLMRPDRQHVSVSMMAPPLATLRNSNTNPMALYDSK